MLNTQGLKPLEKRWKLFEQEGFQCLITIDEDEDSPSPEDEDEPTRWMVKIEVGFDALGSTAALKLTAPSEEIARKMFDGFEDGEKAIQAVIDNAGGAILALMSDEEV